VATREGETLVVNVITFVESVVTVLLALHDGDSVALSGELTPKVWVDQRGTPRPGLDLVAHAVTTPYHAQRKRRVVRDSGKQSDHPRFDDGLLANPSLDHQMSAA